MGIKMHFEHNKICGHRNTFHMQWACSGKWIITNNLFMLSVFRCCCCGNALIFTFKTQSEERSSKDRITGKGFVIKHLTCQWTCYLFKFFEYVDYVIVATWMLKKHRSSDFYDINLPLIEHILKQNLI